MGSPTKRQQINTAEASYFFCMAKQRSVSTASHNAGSFDDVD